MGGTMNRSAFPFRITAVVGLVVAISLFLTGSVGALNPPLQGQVTPEPPPTRDTAIPLPYIELNPTQGVAGDATTVNVSGGLWAAGHTVKLYWDDTTRIVGEVQIRGDGTILTSFKTPTDLPYSRPGAHKVLAYATNGDAAEAVFELIEATAAPPPPPPPPPALTLSPTQGYAGEETRVRATGTHWPAGQTVTLYWDNSGVQLNSVGVSADGSFVVDFRTPKKKELATVAVHVVVAIASGGVTAQANFLLLAPPASDTPEPSPTFTPSPTLRPVTPMVTITPIPPTKAPPRAPVATKAPVPTRTSTPIPGPTHTPSITPTATETPGPGTPSATPQPTSTPTLTPTAEEEISETGGGWGTLFLWGFVLATLLVVFRLLRVKGLQEQG
jgi:hypothetical protein